MVAVQTCDRSSRPAPPAAFEPYDGFLGRVGATLDDLLRAEEARWGPVDRAVARPIRAVAELASAGGKRIRPVLCAWAYRGAGGLDADELVRAAAALEMLHTFALVHDDIIDRSERRRGRPTVHESFRNEHGRRGLRGEGGHYGDSMALLVGDLAFVYADVLLRGVPHQARELFDELRLEMCLGQYLDVLGAAGGADGADVAMAICRYKTATYTVERPLQLGAALAGADHLIPAFGRFGRPLGEAFQLRDDLLGAFGDEQATGKPVGDDFREGKLTLLVSVAGQRASGADRAVLERIGDPAFGPDDVVAIQGVLERTGARDAVDGEVGRLVREALRALDDLPLPDDVRAALLDLARFIAGRSS